MFGFVRDFIAYWPQPSWGVLGAYAALVTVLPLRLVEAVVVDRRQSAVKPDVSQQELQQWYQIANAPAVIVAAAEEGLLTGVAVEISPAAPVQIVAPKLKIQRAKLGLRGQPLSAFRQAPRRALNSKAAKKRAANQLRGKPAQTQRKTAQTRIVSQTGQRSVGHVVSFPVARQRPTVGTRLKRAA
jgi:hypothetical protein